eukprot:CAMPEP_0119115498 /NCGR_PEP_ID=MMETSP1180-20130426/51170_1 /TAXON_ID=3052 ORGANISM="Chlamydomonas cf sp, Strain CCMP681" /NCGR_SAMPLE_ID=MMETSP1180 /ASSEMBLY_ACC=CAM_ASM_000741 /LENGTH=52 /DNA_ID=CAMNT_0007104505 /DNA_START=192 /DNA_END=350 /DNA_ORIENTATION=-
MPVIVEWDSTWGAWQGKDAALTQKQLHHSNDKYNPWTDKVSPQRRQVSGSDR